MVYIYIYIELPDELELMELLKDRNCRNKEILLVKIQIFLSEFPE